MRRIVKKRAPKRGVLGAALLIGTAATALAQPAPFGRSEAPCVLDKCLGGASAKPTPSDTVPAAPPADTQNAPEMARPSRVAPGAFDFYVLSLSWSPGFCQSAAADHAGQQCEPGGRLGFVVHGLWPQNARGYPSNCGTGADRLSRMALDTVRGVYPDEGLARHEWRMHGTCTGLSPTDYFAEVRRAQAAVVIPDQFRSPDSSTTARPIDIARAFVAANPKLRVDTMAVTCRGDTLAEVRICFSKDLRGFVSCPEVARASCRRPVEVPPVL